MSLINLPDLPGFNYYRVDSSEKAYAALCIFSPNKLSLRLFDLVLAAPEMLRQRGRPSIAISRIESVEFLHNQRSVELIVVPVTSRSNELQINEAEPGETIFSRGTVLERIVQQSTSTSASTRAVFRRFIATGVQRDGVPLATRYKAEINSGGGK